MTKYKIMAEYTDEEGKNFKYRKIGVADTMEEALEIGKAIQPNMIITGNFRIVGVCLDTLDEETTYEGLSDIAVEQKIRMYEEDVKFYEKEFAEVSKRKPTKSQAELLETYGRYIARAKRKIGELKNGTYHD